MAGVNGITNGNRVDTGAKDGGRYGFLANFGLAFFTMAIWGHSYIVIRSTVRDDIIPPFTLAFMRFCVASLVLYLFKFVSPPQPKVEKKDSYRIVLMGFLGVFLYFTCENSALVFTSATNASILISVSPVFTMIGASIFFGRKISGVNSVGMLAAFAASAFIVWNGQANFKLNPLGDVLVILSAASWAAYSLVSGDMVKKYNPVMITRRMMFTGVVLFLPFSAWEFFSGRLGNITFMSILGVLYLGVFCSALAYVLWNRVMAALGVVLTTNMLYFQCSITMVCAWILIGEPITPVLVAGTAVLILGVFLANHERTRRVIKTRPRYHPEAPISYPGSNKVP